MSHAKQHKKNAQHHAREQQVLDKYARILQMVAIVGVVIIVVVDRVTHGDTPIWVPAGLLGVAVGISPEQMGKIFMNIFKGLIGGKR